MPASLSRRSAAALVAILTLAGCSPPAARNTAPATPAASAAAIHTPPSPPARPRPQLPVTQASVAPQMLGESLDAMHSPAMRAGLWRNVGRIDGGAAQHTQQCETGRPTPLDLQMQCSARTLNRTITGGYALTATCRAANGAHVQYNVHAEGDFNAHYSTQARVTLSLGSRSVARNLHTESTYAGPCGANAAAPNAGSGGQTINGVAGPSGGGMGGMGGGR